MFHKAHSLKESTMMLGLTDMSQVAHHLEDLFVVAKRDPRVLNARAFYLLFGALDVLSTRVEQLARGNTEPLDIEELCRKLASHVSPSATGPDGSATGIDDVAGETVTGSLPAPSAGVPAQRHSLRVSVEK